MKPFVLRFTLADPAAPLEALLPQEPPLHLGPLTHSERVAAALEAFLLERSTPWAPSSLSHTA